MTDTSSCASYAPENRTLSAAEARARMLAEVVPIAGREFVPLRSALGRILAADIVAPHDVPAHDNSAMDGYAIRFDSLATDGETRLQVVGTAYRRQCLLGAGRQGAGGAHHDRRRAAGGGGYRGGAGSDTASRTARSSFPPASGRARTPAAPARIWRAAPWRWRPASGSARPNSG